MGCIQESARIRSQRVLISALLHGRHEIECVDADSRRYSHPLRVGFDPVMTERAA
jgi:hypothetical protein